MTRSGDGAWIGTTTAGELLGVDPRTLYRIIDSGALPAYRVGRVIRLRRHDLGDYIEALRLQPGDLSHLYPSGPAADNAPADDPDPDADPDLDG